MRPRLTALAGGLLLTAGAVTAAPPASAEPHDTSRGSVRVTGHVVPTGPGHTSLEVRYQCAPSPYRVQVLASVRTPSIYHANTWSRGYSFVYATCDSASHLLAVDLHNAYDQGSDAASFPPGQQVQVGVSLSAFTDWLDDDFSRSFRGVVAADERSAYVGGVPTRCLPVPGTVTPVAGTGVAGAVGRAGDGGAACDAQLAYPTSLAVASDGTVYVADYLDSVVRRLSPDGTIATVAGTGLPGGTGDGGPAVAARLDHPRAVALDADGDLLIADTVSNRVRRVGATDGRIATVAGTGVYGSWGDGGPAGRAQLAGPHGLAVGPDGTLYIADTGNGRLRAVSPDGTVTTLPAQLVAPRSLAADASAVYVSDPGRSAVLRVDLRTGSTTTVLAPVRNPGSLALRGGALLVCAAGDDAVRAVDLSTGAETTVVGGGTQEAPGPPGQLALRQPQGLAVLPSGDLLVADTGHHRLLRWRP